MTGMDDRSTGRGVGSGSGGGGADVGMFEIVVFRFGESTATREELSMACRGGSLALALYSRDDDINMYSYSRRGRLLVVICTSRPCHLRMVRAVWYCE